MGIEKVIHSANKIICDPISFFIFQKEFDQQDLTASKTCLKTFFYN